MFRMVVSILKFNLTFVLASLCLSRIVPAYSTWLCEDTELRGEPSSYDCKPAANYLIATFVNPADHEVTKTIEVSVGPKILKRHILNYVELLNAVKRVAEDADVGGRSVTKKSHVIKIPPNSSIIIVQDYFECSYRNETRGQQVENAVGVYLDLRKGVVHLNATCTEYMDPFGADTVGTEYKGHIINAGEQPTLTRVKYNEKVWYSGGGQFSKNLVKFTLKRKDDETAKLVGWLNGKLHELSPSPKTGLVWSKYKPQNYEESQEKEIQIETPAHSVAQMFQATVWCGEMSVRAWVFPVYLPYGVRPWVSPCNSTEFSPCHYHTGHDTAGPPIVILDHCDGGSDYFMRYGTKEGETQIEINTGVYGPPTGADWKTFTTVLLDGQRKKRIDYGTGFDWSTLKDEGMPEYPTKKLVKIPPKRVQVLQIVGTCEPYMVFTDQLALVEEGPDGECLSVIGVKWGCNGIQMWIREGRNSTSENPPYFDWDSYPPSNR